MKGPAHKNNELLPFEDLKTLQNDPSQSSRILKGDGAIRSARSTRNLPIIIKEVENMCAMVKVVAFFGDKLIPPLMTESL